MHIKQITEPLKVLEPPYVRLIISGLLLYYIADGVYKTPSSVLLFLTSTFGKVVLFCIIFYLLLRVPDIALMVTIAYFITLYTSQIKDFFISNDDGSYTFSLENGDKITGDYMNDKNEFYGIYETATGKGVNHGVKVNGYKDNNNIMTLHVNLNGEMRTYQVADDNSLITVKEQFSQQCKNELIQFLKEDTNTDNTQQHTSNIVDMELTNFDTPSVDKTNIMVKIVLESHSLLQNAGLKVLHIKTLAETKDSALLNIKIQLTKENEDVYIQLIIMDFPLLHQFMPMYMLLSRNMTIENITQAEQNTILQNVKNTIERDYDISVLTDTLQTVQYLQNDDGLSIFTVIDNGKKMRLLCIANYITPTPEDTLVIPFPLSDKMIRQFMMRGMMFPSSIQEGFTSSSMTDMIGFVNPESYTFTDNCQSPQPMSSLSNPCNAVASLQPQLNAQGINHPMGYNGSLVGSSIA